MDESVTQAIAEATLEDGRALVVCRATPSQAAQLVDVMHAAFGARERIGAEAAALRETPATVGQWLLTGEGYLCTLDGEAVGCVLTSQDGAAIQLRRVCVAPGAQGQGIAAFMVRSLLEMFALRGVGVASVLARREYPQLRQWWAQHGFVEQGAEGDCVVMVRRLPVALEVPTAQAMQALGRGIGAHAQGGDVIIASGDLGAGKTTFTQGLAQGLGVEGPVLSPTFVLARVHRSTTGGPALVHADAYRLGGWAELEDLDLEESLDGAVTLVEWGSGMAEPLADEPLYLDIRRSLDPDDDTRWVFLTPTPTRWTRTALDAAAAHLENA